MRRFEQSLSLWHQALESPLGIRVETDDVRQLTADLYQSRKESGDTRLFQFYISQGNGEVLLVRCVSAPVVKTNGEYKPLEDI